MAINSAALDRWITGNYGEDQYAGAVTCDTSEVDEYLEGLDLGDDFGDWLEAQTAGPGRSTMSYLHPEEWPPHLRTMIAAFLDDMREKYASAAEERKAERLAERSY